VKLEIFSSNYFIIVSLRYSRYIYKSFQNYFRAFGEIKSLRLPLKLTPGESTHRGFGFVDFYTNSDAKVIYNILI